MAKNIIHFGGTHPELAQLYPPAAAEHGQATSPAYSDMTWGDQTKYRRVGWPFPEPQPLDLDKLSDEQLRIEFKQWIGTVWAMKNAVPGDDELATFDLHELEEEFRRDYRSGGWREMENGASVEGIWVAEQLINRKPYVWLINRDQVRQPLDRISRKEFFGGSELVWLLGASCIQFEIDEPALPIATFDGQTGHVVYLAGLNPWDYPHPAGVTVRRGWFSFHDPWPARSLLTAELNSARVAAIEDYPRAPNWLLAPEELKRVIYGTWLPTKIWEALSDLVQTARVIEAERREGRGVFPSPPWGDNEAPFADLIALAGGATGSESVCALGHGRWLVEQGELAPAERWFEEYVQLEEPKAARDVARVYDEHGQRDRAKQWLERAAEAGDVPAAGVLGMWLTAEDEDDSSGRARYWLKLAAEQGDVDAAEALGTLLARSEDRNGAVKWFRRAAESGHSMAAAKLGMLLAEEQDEEAEAWLKQAVDAGVVEAANVLAGIHYDRGDKATARSILEWARDRGDQEAAAFLEALYSD